MESYFLYSMIFLLAWSEWRRNLSLEVKSEEIVRGRDYDYVLYIFIKIQKKIVPSS